MAKDATAQPVDTVEAVSGRLTTATVRREALQRYPWPLPMRLAGYVVIAAVLLSLLAHESVYHHSAMYATAALTGVFLLGYHLLSGGKPQLRPRQGLAIVAVQILCALAIDVMVNGDGTAGILLYVVAAELQFLVAFRLALAGTVGLWFLSVGTYQLIVVRLPGALSLQGIVTDAAMALSGFVFVAALTRSAVTEIVQRHQATILLDELRVAHQRLQSYADSIEALTASRERNRIARDIHDTLGHYLTVINVQIETAQKLSTRDATRSQVALATAKTLASECLAEVRRSVEALRPAALDGIALPEAIARLIDDVRRASGVAIHVEGQGAGTLSPASEVAVYHVIQEAMTNVRKHAQAHNVWLRTEWGPAWFTASVRDDGRGAMQADGASRSAGGFGVHGMRERAAAVGGTLEVTTAPGAGFCVLLRVPSAPASLAVLVEQRPRQEASVP